MAVSKIPESIETMRPAAAAAVRRLYHPLMEQLKLTPEQTDKFYQLLIENKMTGLAQRTELLSHGDIGRLHKDVADSTKELEAGLQALLGDANFAQYQEYQSSVEDRGALHMMMKIDFAETPLTGEQEQSLLQA